jgi:hypothetical protein
MNDAFVSSAQEGIGGGAARQWLLLIHQLPPEPAYIRVKVRRRLQRLGAVPLKNSVYVLPEDDENLEDFQWLANEIAADGGDATICSASMLSGVTDDELASLFPRLETAKSVRASKETTPLPRGATWVTREGVFIDRIASAWLIRRFIDPDAEFRFVPAKGYRKKPDEIRFDMYQGEYTHVGDRCTFETLLHEFGLTDPALRAIGEIVHDIDLKDEKFSHAETPGVLAVMQGVALAMSDDADRIARGSLILDGLYSQVQRER